MPDITFERWLYAGIVLVLYAWLCAATAYRQRQLRQQAAHDTALFNSAADAGAWLIAYASQTGNAEQLAWHTARSLHVAGIKTRVMSLAQIYPEDLHRTERALFIVSTYGEGDAPDNAASFVDRCINGALSLSHLHYGMMALGDRTYKRFCGFGRALNQWLQTQGAQALFKHIEVDNNHAAALHEWQHRLSHIAGSDELPDWQAPAYTMWRLAARRLLNPGSSGGPCFHLELEPASDNVTLDWQAGDLVQVQTPDEPERPREYSIASLPADGRVHLLVRQEQHADGTLGTASGWLTTQLQPGDSLQMRIRTHNNFHLRDNSSRPLILIGNGTGLAGLRSHLKARAAAGQQRNWLIFGERNAAYDRYYADELSAWQQQGVLQRLDLVFSRDQVFSHNQAREYVQDRLRTHAVLVREWCDAGAAFYICGSLQGMANGVQQALIEILGNECVAQLAATGRYRRDVY